MNLNECIKKRLIRKDKPDKEKAKKALEMAKERLTDAEISIDAEIPSATIILAYSAMFHASRALLFRNGFTEKSHLCLYLFIKERYIKTGRISQKFSFLLKNAREERHEVLYALEKKETVEDAQQILNNAKEYIKAVEKILKKKKCKKMKKTQQIKKH